MPPVRTAPLVLLPGMGCSASLWDNVLPKLRVGLPGVQVETPELTARTLDVCIDSLLAALPARFALAGLSLGGIVAMAAVRRAPERLTGLCLMSTNPGAPTDAQRGGWAAQRHRIAQGAHARDLQRDLLPVLLSREPSGQVREAVLSMADHVGDAAYDAQLALQTTRLDERAALSRITVPALIIAAERDALCPLCWHVDMAQRIPNARLVQIPDAGHLSPVEAPDAVADAMLPWVRESCGDSTDG